MRRTTGAKRRGDTVRAHLDQLTPPVLEPAVIKTVTVGGASDGADLITVTWRGADIRMAHPAGLALTTGQTVIVAAPPDGTPFILCRLVGTP